MPLLFLFGLLGLSLTAAAQYDAGGQNTQGADTDASKFDPATKARVRAEGSVGGIKGGQKLESQQQGASSGASSSAGAGPEPRVANESSSDREAGRGARGSQPQESAGKKGD